MFNMEIFYYYYLNAMKKIKKFINTQNIKKKNNTDYIDI